MQTRPDLEARNALDSMNSQSSMRAPLSTPVLLGRRLFGKAFQEGFRSPWNPAEISEGGLRRSMAAATPEGAYFQKLLSNA